MVDDGSSFYVQIPEVEVVEVDGPGAGSDLFEADELAAEELADVDPGGVPADAAVGADLPDLEVSQVLRLRSLICYPCLLTVPHVVGATDTKSRSACGLLGRATRIPGPLETAGLTLAKNRGNWPMHPSRPITTLILAAMVGCGDSGPTEPAPIPTAGLVAHLTFNGNATDQSGNGNSGTLVGGATAAGDIVIGANDSDALSLPGSTMDGLGDFTFAAWMRLDTLHGGGHFALSGANAGDDNVVGISYDEFRAAWRFGEAGDNFTFSGDSSIEDGQWHHVAVTRSGTAAQLYVGGVPIGTTLSVPGNVLDIDPTGLIIGQDQDLLGGGFEVDQSWAGAMDNLRIYERALNGAEVGTLAQESR